MIRRTLRRLAAALVERGRADHPPRAHRPRSLAPLPRRPRPDGAAALYALAGSPLAPDDIVLVTESGAIVHHHFLGGQPC